MSALLAGYFLASYPGAAASLELLKKAEADLDIFEIGYPSKNPAFDGEVISNAHNDVIKKGCPDLSYWKKLRSAITKPLWVMAYKSDFIDSGLYRTFAEEKIADAFVLPDCTDHERLLLQAELSPKGIDVIGFANAHMSIEDFKTILMNHKNIYFQLYVGKTGSAGVESDPAPYLETAKAFPGRKIFAGFGIATAEKARSLTEQGFDGVIIGTAFIKALNKSEKALFDLTSDIANAVRA